MKKNSKFFIKHYQNVKNLLDELTLREMESTQLKINELIHKQKSNLALLKLPRALQLQKILTPSRKKDTFTTGSNVKVQNRYHNDKENTEKTRLCYSVNLGLADIKIKQKKVTSQRKLNQKGNHIKLEQPFTDDSRIMTVNIPSIKKAKKNSIQEHFEQKNQRMTHNTIQNSLLTTIQEIEGGIKPVKSANHIRISKLTKKNSIAFGKK